MVQSTNRNDKEDDEDLSNMFGAFKDELSEMDKDGLMSSQTKQQ